MSKLITALTLLACSLMVFSTDEVFAADQDKKQLAPQQIISQLRNRITAIGEGQGKPEDFTIATNTAVDTLRAFIAKGENLDLLTAKDKWGKTPLNYAAYMGFSEIVAELLNHPNAKLTLNEEDDHGVTPWTYANFAARQSAFACNPIIFTSPFSWAPLHMGLPYYVAYSPYPKVRKQLEDAGAIRDMAKAKRQWHQICKSQTPQTRAAVEASDNFQQVVIDAGDKAIRAFIDKLQGR